MNDAPGTHLNGGLGGVSPIGPTRMPFTGRAGIALLAAMLQCGCASILLPKPADPPTLFELNDSSLITATTASPPDIPTNVATPTLIVNVMRAAAGYSTAFIVYARRANEIEYFNDSRWVQSPAEMLTPIIARALERSHVYRAVVRAPTSARGDWLLDTELVRLQHDFSVAPSRVHLTLRANLIDTGTHRVVASQEFAKTVVSASEDARGGVVAANLAVQQVMVELARYCATRTSATQTSAAQPSR